MAGHSFGMRAAAVLEGGWQGAPSICGRLRCPRAAAGHPFDMRAAAVPEGGSRAPLRHAGSCGARGRRQGLAGLRADAPSRRLAARTASGRAAALGCREQLGRRTAALGCREQLGRRAAALGCREQLGRRATALGCRKQLGRRADALEHREGPPALRGNDRERRPYPSAARSPRPARTQQPCPQCRGVHHKSFSRHKLSVHPF